MSFAVTAAVGLTAASIYTGEKARKQQREAGRKQERIRQAQTARDRMAQVRQQRIAQAQIIQGAATEGTMGSSAAQGGYSAVGALTSGNIQFMNQIDSLQQGIARNMEKAGQYAGQSGMFNAAANLSLMGAQMAPNKTASTPGQQAYIGQSTVSGNNPIQFKSGKI